jgi:hypothetical protein
VRREGQASAGRVRAIGPGGGAKIGRKAPRRERELVERPLGPSVTLISRASRLATISSSGFSVGPFVSLMRCSFHRGDGADPVMRRICHARPNWSEMKAPGGLSQTLAWAAG